MIFLKYEGVLSFLFDHFEKVKEIFLGKGTLGHMSTQVD